jgi:hypothetical protein
MRGAHLPMKQKSPPFEAPRSAAPLTRPAESSLEGDDKKIQEINANS